MSDNKTTIHFPFFGLLALLFIGLKLTGHIGWSWWWVLSPLWIPVAIALAIVVVCCFVAIGAFVAESRGRKQRVARTKSRGL